MKRRYFEEEVPAEEQEVVEETTTEESAPDSHEQFVNILVEMGLTAEQAEAVHSMAMDLVNAAGEAPAAEETKEELSRDRRRRFARRRAARRNRQEMGYSKKPRRPKRSEFSRRGRSDRQEVMMNRLRAQRKEIIELKKQLVELGQQPSAQPVTRTKSNFQQAEPLAPNASIKDRVLAKIGNLK